MQTQLLAVEVVKQVLKAAQENLDMERQKHKGKKTIVLDRIDLCNSRQEKSKQNSFIFRSSLVQKSTLISKIDA